MLKLLVKNNSQIINQLTDRFEAACALTGISKDDVNSKSINEYSQKGVAIVSEYYITFNDGSFKFTMQQNEDRVQYWYPRSVFVAPEDGEAFAIGQSANMKYDNLLNYYPVTLDDLKVMCDHAERISAWESDNEEVDLNGDGKLEKITIENIGYNGGDGGYCIKVMSSDGVQINLPEYDNEEGFPYRLKKDANKDFQLVNSVTNESFDITCPTDFLVQYYNENSFSNHKLTFDKEFSFICDMTSGYIVKDIDVNGETKAALIIKSYVSGLDGHVDTLGYIISTLILNEDNTWTYKHDFLPWNGKFVSEF